jgi:hypothetical protein
MFAECVHGFYKTLKIIIDCFLKQYLTDVLMETRRVFFEAGNEYSTLFTLNS